MIVDNQLLLRHANTNIHRQAGERYAFFDAQSEILIQKTEEHKNEDLFGYARLSHAFTYPRSQQIKMRE